jgi:hypothetical protein
MKSADRAPSLRGIPWYLPHNRGISKTTEEKAHTPVPWTEKRIEREARSEREKN